jgi:hypothetical protein
MRIWKTLDQFHGNYSMRSPSDAVCRVCDADILVHRKPRELTALSRILAWRRRRDRLLAAVGCAAAAHFLLYPSGEERYLI